MSVLNIAIAIILAMMDEDCVLLVALNLVVGVISCIKLFDVEDKL